MSKVTILDSTVREPYNMIGRMAGICWGANVNDWDKNYRRGYDCIKSRHGRTWEYVEVYMVLEGWSARVIREFYTHIGGAPTRLQESTRYVDCSDFNYVLPPRIAQNITAQNKYHETMQTISKAICTLEDLGIPREDSAMLLPLGMSTKIVVRMNLRTLVDMAHQRLCVRAYWEYRKLMKTIMDSLSLYSAQWEDLVADLFVPKCEDCGFCREKNSCGKYPIFEVAQSQTLSKADPEDILNKVIENWDFLTEEQKDDLSFKLWCDKH